MKESIVKLKHKIAKLSDKMKEANETALQQMELKRQWLVLRVHQRLAVCISQALTALVTAIYQQLQTSVGSGGRDESLLHWGTCGILVGWESLLSTYKKENHMLGDFCGAVEHLHNLKLRLLPLPGLRRPRVDIDWQQGPPPGGGNTDHVDEPFDTDLLLTLFVPGAEFNRLPPELRQEQQLRVVICLFSQGVNEQQTIANAKGHTALQERINIRSISLLEEYLQRYATCRLGTHLGEDSDITGSSTSTGTGEVRGEKTVGFKLRDGSNVSRSAGGLDSGLALPTTQQLEGMSRAEREVLEARLLVRDARSAIAEGVNAVVKTKDTRVLTLTAHALRVMQGAKLVSCKSAKDRTSMSLTGEQVAILQRWHQLPESVAADTLEDMRSLGVRMHNTFNNVGKAGYAFNALQRMLLPKTLRASAKTTVSVQS